MTKVSKRNVKSHMEYNKQIVKGTKYVKLDNGTIGAGARSSNIPLELILKEFTMDEIKQAIKLSRADKTSSVDHVYDVWPVLDKPKEDKKFNYDDIPF